MITGPVSHQEKTTNQSSTTQTNKETQVLINQLPTDILKRIFGYLDPADLAKITHISKLWYGLVHNLSQNFIQRYFPYLMHHPLFTENPLKLVVQETRSYQRGFPQIKVPLILDALSGDRKIITTVKDQNIKMVLYSLYSANNHLLPDNLSEEEKKQIHINEFRQYARIGKLDKLKEYLSKILPNELQGMLPDIFTSAAANGQHEVIQFLLKYSAWEDHDLSLALDQAAKGNHVEVVKLLLPKCEHEPETINWTLRRDLFVATAGGGHLDVVKFLLPEGDTFIKPWDKEIALGRAIMNGHLEVVKYLMPQMRNGLDRLQIFPLWVAAYFGHLEIVKYLLPLEPVGHKKQAYQAAKKQGHLQIAVVIESDINAAAKRLNTLKNFLNTPGQHPFKATFLLGSLALTSALFIPLESALMLSGALSLSAYIMMRVRNYYTKLAERMISNRNYRIQRALDPVCKKNHEEKHAAYVNGYHAANSWVVYFNDSLNPAHWKYASYYNLGMKIGAEQDHVSSESKDHLSCSKVK